MKKILLVDDEMLVLAGLERLLRPMNHEWEIVFVNSGQAAREKLQFESFDILITDLKMPGVTGAQLLAEVRDHYPQIVRLALSGCSSEELTLQSVPLAHQYLSKPCDPQLLQQTLRRICAQRDLLPHEPLQRLLSRLPSLPALPELYLQLTQELEATEASLERIGQIIAQDVAMTAKLLQVVNSAFFGLKREISHPRDAAFFLGVETLRSLVLSLQIFSTFQADEKLRVTPEALWAYSLQVAQLAKAIAKAEQPSPKVVEEAFTAGLLHKIGILVLTSKLQLPYEVVEALTQKGDDSLITAERKVFGVAHPEVGAYLLGLWGLPNGIVEAVAFHHEPSRGTAPLTFSVLTAVHIANHLLTATQPTEQSLSKTAPLDQVYIDKLGLGERIPRWQEKLLAQEAREPAKA